jgi:hypothetical protein
MRYWLLVIIIAVVGCEGWRKQDTALEVAFVSTAAIDWKQTIEITGDCAEENPMIGTCGHRVPVNIYFPIAILAHAAVAAVLPHTWRTLFQAFTTGVEASTIYSNSHAGYEML